MLNAPFITTCDSKVCKDRPDTVQRAAGTTIPSSNRFVERSSQRFRRARCWTNTQTAGRDEAARTVTTRVQVVADTLRAQSDVILDREHISEGTQEPSLHRPICHGKNDIGKRPSVVGFQRLPKISRGTVGIVLKGATPPCA